MVVLFILYLFARSSLRSFKSNSDKLSIHPFGFISVAMFVSTSELVVAFDAAENRDDLTRHRKMEKSEAKTSLILQIPHRCVLSHYRKRVGILLFKVFYFKVTTCLDLFNFVVDKLLYHVMLSYSHLPRFSKAQSFYRMPGLLDL